MAQRKRTPTLITTPFPTLRRTAKILGVPKHEAMVLAEAAERAEKTGVFSLPGVRRVARIKGKKTGIERRAENGTSSRVSGASTKSKSSKNGTASRKQK